MKMKLVAIALSGAFLASSVAVAEGFDPSFYVGGEAQINKLKNGKDFSNKDGKSYLRKKTTPGGSVFVGTRLHENFGLEAGYTVMKQNKNTQENGVNLKVKTNNAHLDALGYVPVSDCVDLIGSVGIGRLNTKLHVKDENGTKIILDEETKKLAKAKAGVRLGAGVQYKFTDNVGARLMVRHQRGNKLIKNVNSAGVGLFYQF